MITQTMNLNLIPGQVKPRFNISQYDTGSRTLRFLLYNGSSAFNLTSAMNVLIQGIKPDKHGFSYNATRTAGSNVVTADLTFQMSIVAGDVECELVIMQGSKRLGTLNFILAVEKAPLNDDTDISETDIPTIIEIAEKQLEECIENRLDAEAWARGTKDGAAVQSTDEQHHNNSRYYAQESADSAEAAQKSAEDSQDSAEDAQKSAEDAQKSAEDSQNSAQNAEAWAVGERDGVPVSSTDETYENNSKYYAEEAADSQAAAKLSEQNAKASEDILNYYVTFVIPRFIIQNNRLYMSDAAAGEFIVANNRLYIKNAS